MPAITITIIETEDLGHIAVFFLLQRKVKKRLTGHKAKLLNNKITQSKITQITQRTSSQSKITQQPTSSQSKITQQPTSSMSLSVHNASYSSYMSVTTHLLYVAQRPQRLAAFLLLCWASPVVSLQRRVPYYY